MTEAALDNSPALDRCPRCGYDLSHAVSDRCPECGLGIEDDEAIHTYLLPWLGNRNLFGRWVGTLGSTMQPMRLASGQSFALPPRAGIGFRRATWALLMLVMVPISLMTSYVLRVWISDLNFYTLSQGGVTAAAPVWERELIMLWMSGTWYYATLGVGFAWWCAMLLGVPAVVTKWLGQGEAAIRERQHVLSRFAGGSALVFGLVGLGISALIYGYVKVGTVPGGMRQAEPIDHLAPLLYLTVGLGGGLIVGTLYAGLTAAALARRGPAGYVLGVGASLLLITLATLAALVILPICVGATAHALYNLL